MPADRTLTLGTIFTADARQFLQTTERIRRSINSLNTAMGGITAKQKENKKALDAQRSATQAATGSFQGFTKQIAKVEGGIKRTIAAFKVTAAYGIAARAIYGVIEAVSAGVTEIIEFDQAMMNLAAITGATESELLSMRDVMIEVAKTTKFSTTEIAEGMVLLGQSGFSAGEAMDSIQAAADLASGTLSDLKTTTDLLTTTIRAFNLEAIESGKVADVMANSINKSKLTLDKIRTSFNFVGASAAQVGLTLEETTASMALLANNGLRASTIGTGLRQVLSRMIAPNRKLRDAFNDFGISLDDISPKTAGYKQAMEKLTKVIMKTDGVTVDMAKAFSLFGLRGAQAVAVLAQSFATGDFDDMLENMYEVGAAAKMATIQAKGLAFQLKNLKDRAGALAIAIGDSGLKGVISGFVVVMKVFVDLLTNVLGTGLGRVAIQVLGVSVAFLALSKSVVVLIGVWGALMKGMAFVASPWALLAVVIIGATFAIRDFMKAEERATEAAMKHSEEMAKKQNSLGLYIQTLKDITESVDENSEVSKEHLAILARMKDAHPELASAINEATESYKAFGDVIREASAEMERAGRARLADMLTVRAPQLENLRKIQKELLGYRKTLEDLTSAGKGFFRREKSIAEMAEKVYKTRQKEIEVTKELRLSLQNVRGAIFGLVQWEEEAVLAAKAYTDSLVQSSALSQQEADIILGQLIPALEKLQARRKRSKAASTTEQIKEDKKAQLKYKTMLLSFAKEEDERIKLKHEKALLEIDDFQKEQKSLLQKAGHDMEAAEKISMNRAANLRRAANNRRGFEETALRIDIEQAEADLARSLEEIRLLEEKSRALGNRELLENIEKQEEEHKRKIIEQDVEFAKRRLAISEEVGTAKEVRDAQAKLVALREELAKFDAKLAEILFKKTEKQTGTMKGALQNIKEQITNLIEGTRTWENVWKKINESVPVAISEGIAGALWDVVDGTKSASDAFGDMARSMLRWLGELIIKQTILNALRSWFPSIFPVPIAHTGGVVGKDIPAPKKMHTGGIVGGAGSSLSRNEIPVIANKGEGIFTKEQMSAIGGMAGKGVTLNASFDGATFLDKEQMNEAFAALAMQVSMAVVNNRATAVIVQDFNNDGPIRNMVRGGA